MNVGMRGIKHSNNKVTEDKLFIEGVTRTLVDITAKLNFHKSNA